MKRNIHYVIFIALILFNITTNFANAISSSKSSGGDRPDFLNDESHISLRRAIAARDVQEIRKIIGNYPNILNDTTHECFLHMAIEKGNLGTIEAILEGKPEMRGDCNSVFAGTPLCSGIVNSYNGRYTDLQVINLFLANGVDVNERCFNGKTPIMLANSSSAISLLLDNGADINAIDDEGNTALLLKSIYCTSWMNRDSCDGAVGVLLKRGANPNLKNKLKENALMASLWTYRFGAKGNISSMILSYMDINHLNDVDHLNRTALDIAYGNFYHSSPIVLELISRGVTNNKPIPEDF